MLWGSRAFPPASPQHCGAFAYLLEFPQLLSLGSEFLGKITEKPGHLPYEYKSLDFPTLMTAMFPVLTEALPPPPTAIRDLLFFK